LLHDHLAGSGPGGNLELAHPEGNKLRAGIICGFATIITMPHSDCEEQAKKN